MNARLVHTATQVARGNARRFNTDAEPLRFERRATETEPYKARRCRGEIFDRREEKNLPLYIHILVCFVSDRVCRGVAGASLGGGAPALFFGQRAGGDQ
jgi:hypothetical protein